MYRVRDGRRRSRSVRFGERPTARIHKILVGVAVTSLMTGGGAVAMRSASAANRGLNIEPINDANLDERRSGSVVVPVDGVYQFVVSGDESDLWVDGVQLVDYWQNSAHDRFGKIRLRAGVEHDLLWEIKAAPGDVRAQLEWSGPSFGRQPVADENLRPSRGNRRDVTWGNSLKNNAAERGLLIGTAITPDGTEGAQAAQYKEVLEREFSFAPPEWALTATFDVENGNPITNDQYVEPMLAVSEANGQQSQGFHLLWHEFGLFNEALPKVSIEKRRAFVKSHIQTLMGKYRGRVGAWNVVNEAFNDQGQRHGPQVFGGGKLFENWLYGLGGDFIADAFRLARQTDPNALLFYNDYGLEVDGPKWEAVLAMVKQFKAQGVPIDGVGFQGHLDVSESNQVELGVVREHFRQLNELGVKVRITELDVGIQNGSGTEAERVRKQSDLIWLMTTACLQSQDCDVVNMWGLSDNYSWRSLAQYGGSPANKPTLFDADLNKKQPYWWMQGALLRPLE
jgi:endo-1,4-beta-xylanase